MRNHTKNWFTNPWLILGSILLGLFIGYYAPGLAHNLASLGQLYLSLMAMCILPMMITAIISSLGRLLHSRNVATIIKRLMLVLIAGLFFAALISVVASLLLKPGAWLSDEARQLLSSKILAPLATDTASQSHSFLGLLAQMVPANIFNALSNGHNLAVLFFSILLGVALGTISFEGAQRTVESVHVFYLALMKIVNWIMYGLPVGLCFLFTGYASQVNFQELLSVMSLVVVIIIVGFGLVIVCSIIIWQQTKLSYFKSLQAVKTPLLIGFATCSSFTAIPALIESLEKNLKVERNLAELVTPLGVNLFRPGSILRLTITGMFVAQLYNQSLTIEQLGIVVLTSIMAGIAASGVPGIMSISMLAFVLDPLGLPTTLGIIVLLIITPIIDPLVTLLNVYSSCVLAVLLQKRHKSKSE